MSRWDRDKITQNTHTQRRNRLDMSELQNVTIACETSALVMVRKQLSSTMAVRFWNSAGVQRGNATCIERLQKFLPEICGLSVELCESSGGYSRSYNAMSIITCVCIPCLRRDELESLLFSRLTSMRNISRPMYTFWRPPLVPRRCSTLQVIHHKSPTNMKVHVTKRNTSSHLSRDCKQYTNR